MVYRQNENLYNEIDSRDRAIKVNTAEVVRVLLLCGGRPRVSYERDSDWWVKEMDIGTMPEQVNYIEPLQKFRIDILRKDSGFFISGG